MKFTRGRIAAIGGLAAVGSLAVVMAGADAHHPEIAASTSCSAGSAVVSVRAYSWVTDEGNEHRYNSNIEVSLDGSVIGTGAFLPSNNFEFTVDSSVPADGSSHVARVTAKAPFGPDGQFVVQEMFRETTVSVPSNCEEGGGTTTTTTTAAPTTAAPTTTAAPATTAAPTTTAAPVVVGGIVETRTEAPAAVPVDALPAFAG